ncbi:MAG: IS5 family transposase [Jiangellaceae bacterium]
MASSRSSSRRYPSDLTDKQWPLLEPLLPPPSTAGRHEKHPRREVVNAIFYVVRTGCSWRQLPLDFPPWQTVYWYFKRWNAEGAVDRLHDALRDQLRDEADRDPMASAAIVDAQRHPSAPYPRASRRAAPNAGGGVGMSTPRRVRH